MRKRIAVLLAALMTAFGSIASAQIQPTIRVYLRRLGVQDTIRIEVKGTYMIEGGSMYFSDGTLMTIALREGNLVLHTGGTAILMGESMRLMRCAEETPGALLLNGEGGLYEGDLSLTVQDGAIRPILFIDVEDYLLGVVPYEMGDSFPLEALKAQAIAARTYALRKSGSDGDYDVEDTTNDQAYRGRTAYSPLSEQAVKETTGLCGTYKGSLAQCFYSASNGGQTELGQHVWPTSDPDAYGYMDMRDDPYDLENEASVVKRYTLEKKPGKKGIGAALHSALVLALSEQLEALGHAAVDDLVRFDEITSLTAVEPKFDGNSRLMTQLRFQVKVSVRDALYRDEQPAAFLTPNADAGISPTPSPTPRPTATPVYSPYTALPDELTVTLPIFTAGEQAMGLSINIAKNELITVYDIGSAYMIESRRYGHGVGMSQRGAQQMAAEHGMSYQQILTFYYPGLELMSYAAQRTPQPTANMTIVQTPAPTPSPTPRPTLMPVSTQGMEEGAYLAMVENIEEDSSLNLREAPSLSAEIKRRLYKGQQLIVLTVTPDGWAYVRTDVTDGYVRTEYLQAAEVK